MSIISQSAEKESALVINEQGQPQIYRLSNFFAEASALLSAPDNRVAVACPVDGMRLNEFMREAEDLFEHARANVCANPWVTAGLASNEVRISAALASLWDYNCHGDSALEFLAQFFEAIGPALPDRAELGQGYRVSTEHCPNGDRQDRVDITIETKTWIIGIEVKIYAAEGRKQLKRYIETIKSRANFMGRCKNEVLFLAPYKPSIDNVPAADWKMLSRAALSVDRDTKSAWLINQFGVFTENLGG